MNEEIKFEHNGKSYIVGELKVPNSELTYDIACIFEVCDDFDGDKFVFVNYFYGATLTTDPDKIIEIAKSMIR